jgi:DNA-binding NarL/FixJ family response regulator
MAVAQIGCNGDEPALPYCGGSGAADEANTNKNSRSAKAARGFPSTLVIVERNAFMRDCLTRSLEGELIGDVVTCASLSELIETQENAPRSVVLLSIVSLNKSEADAEFERIAQLGRNWTVMVLAKADDLDVVLTALDAGVSGYIAMSSEFPIFIEALRFVAAGGTYVPAQCLLAAKQGPAAPAGPSATDAITSREFAVIQAIRQGKPNKVIAYELNMCESTVKVHVRHVMKKLNAHNRTEIAVMGAELKSGQGRGALNDSK